METSEQVIDDDEQEVPVKEEFDIEPPAKKLKKFNHGENKYNERFGVKFLFLLKIIKSN